MAAGTLVPPAAEAKIVHLLPRPQSLTATSAEPFSLGRAVRIADPTGCTVLRSFFESQGGVTDDASAPLVTVEMVESISGVYDYALEGFPAEGYQMEVKSDAIVIKVLSPTGTVRAAQTLAQLAEGYDGTAALETLTMTDWPAFKLRGWMHDVGRSFVSVEEIKKEIDLLSRFKVNTFHFHMTENQAWRFEVKKYPKLTDASSMTRFAGSYFTQEQCKDIEEYAAERGVIVIPEIDMPGHSEAFKRAMGFDMQTAEGVAVLQDILEEVADVFERATYIHIGADEKAITYPNFLKIMIDKVHSLGKKVVVWNPISGVTISKDAGFDMTQMWSTAGRKITGIANIDCRYNYTNHFDVFADLVGIYKSSIYYQDKGSAEVAGTISAYWNDRKSPTQTDIIRQNNLYANVLASAERAWIGGGKQYIEEGGTTLPNSGEEFDEFADWESRFLFHKDHSLKDEPIPYVKQTNVRWRITDAFPNGGNKDLQLPPETEGLKDTYTYNGATYGTGMATGAAVYLRHTWGGTIPTYFSNPQTNTTAYAWTYVYSSAEQTAGALIEFQNYGRSEVDKAPDAGKWDRKGSRIWVNDEEVMPPVWENTGKAITQETDLRNENFTMRAPEQIKLKKGWNKVFIKLPYVTADGVRLNKWMFTFVLTDTEGRNALDGLIYSPDQCMDADAEQVAATISDMRRYRNSVVADAPGFYPESCATEMDAEIAKVEATLSEELSAEERSAQKQALADALEAFKAALADAELVQPQASTEAEEHWYYMNTPLRESRYPTGKGVNAEIIGEKNTSAAACWKFVKRADGDYDIVNYANGTYVSPESNNNTALRTVAASPSAGWTLKPADEVGYFIIVSGSAQFNQTNNATLGYKVYNWGDGSNTTDTGCKYRIFAVEELPARPGEVTVPASLLTLVGMEFDGSGPYRVPDEMAKPVLEASAVTVAVDFTLASASGEMGLVGSSNSAAPEQFVTVNVTNGNNFGVRYGNNGERYTSNATIGTSRHQAVVTMQTASPSYNYYLDGTLLRDVAASVFTPGSVPGVDGLYLGGIVCSDNANKYPLRGTIHSAQFFPGVLTAEQVAAIKYDGLAPTGIHSPGSLPGTEISVEGGRISCATPFRVFTVDGRDVTSGSAKYAPGLYIVKANQSTAKILVK